MSDGELLSPQQERALLAVMEGDDYTGAALVAGVRRETVSRWANNDTPWARERRRRTEALWAEYQNQALSLVPYALGALTWLLRNRDYLGDDYDPKVQLAAALAVLRLVGIDTGRSAGLVINNLLAQQVNASAPDE